jgi:hypothetical protein
VAALLLLLLLLVHLTPQQQLALDWHLAVLLAA